MKRESSCRKMRKDADSGWGAVGQNERSGKENMIELENIFPSHSCDVTKPICRHDFNETISQPCLLR